jgi:hypothetical protein
MAERIPEISAPGFGSATSAPGPRTSKLRFLASDRRFDVAAVAVLVLCLVGMFWKVIFTSAMFFHRDIYNYTFPSARYIHDICRHGFLPYWNPYLNYGQPVLANPNLLFFYPFTLLIVLLPAGVAFTMHFLVHFAWAAIGVYVLARTWGQTWRAALVAAMFFMLSGPVLSLGDLYNESACAAWIPWALLATHRAVERPRMRRWVALVVIFSFQWLAGEPMTMLATFGLCFAYAWYATSETGNWKLETRTEPTAETENWKLEFPAGSKVEAGDSQFEARKLSRFSSFQFPVSSFRLPVSSFRFPKSPTVRAFARVLAIFILVGVGMLLLCAVQFLPASDLLSQSRRGLQGLRFRETANWAVNPLSLPQMLVPDFFGSGISAPSGWPWLMSDSNLPYFLSVFIGFVPLFFALAGWALGRTAGILPTPAGCRQDAGVTGLGRSNFVAGAAGVFLLLSFGHFTPVFALAYLLFPPLAVVRYPVKLLVLVTFLVAILAGWGFDALLSPSAPWKHRGRRLFAPLVALLAAIVAVLAVAWLAPNLIISPTRWALRRVGETPFDLRQMPNFLVTILRYQLPGLAGFCLGGMVLAYGLEQGKAWARPGLYAFALLGISQLVMANSAADPTVPKTFFNYRPPVLKEFKDPPGTYRVSSLWPVVQTPDTKNLQTYINFDSVPEAAGLSPEAQAAFQTRTQLAAGSMINQVEGSINLDLERSLPPYLYDIEIYQDRHAAEPGRVDCLLGRTNVKYIIRPSPADSAATRALGNVFNGSPKPSRLYEDLCFVPRAYVAGEALFTTSSADTLDLMASPDFDAHEKVILAATSNHAEPSGTARHGPADEAGASAGQAEIVHRDPNSVTLRAQMARPGYVVLLDRYDPNWRATLDGRPVPVYRANQIFRAVYAGAGLHEIRFQYHQRGLRLGVIISLLTAATLAVLCWQG